MKKVFCSDCKYCKFVDSNYRCLFGMLSENTLLHKRMSYEFCKVANKNNSCKYFSLKFFKKIFMFLRGEPQK